MFFFLEYKSAHLPAIPEIRILKPDEVTTGQHNTLHLRTGAQRLERVDTPGGQLVLLGDPILPGRDGLGQRLNTLPGLIDEAALYEEIRGHYYWFFFYSEGLLCGSSFGALFPVYYQQKAKGVVICSSASFLAEAAGMEERDTRNLLERLLFNYPLFRSTWWKNISLLEAHRFLHISPQSVTIEGEFAVNSYFGPVASKSSESNLRQLVTLFEEEVELFIPDQPFGISFTGGFDGRTLVAAAQQNGREFITYSFGRSGDSDLTFPAAQAQKLGIPYLPILLDEEYLEKEALKSAFSFMKLTDYNGNLGRPHYEYAARKLSKQVDYILTGNFGSELFRAMHEPGVMMTKHLIHLFASEDDSWKDALVAATDGWAHAHFQEDLDSLIADLEQYLAARQNWEPNHRFYDFVFNELFRKYFGPELIMQTNYFNNRTPFLSLRFFRELNRTPWAGVHSRLFEKNLSKRMKGQVFYSSFIRHAHRQLYYLNTNKGYGPADVLEPWRLPLLAGKVLFQKKIKKQEPDSNAVNSFFRARQAHFSKWIGTPQKPMPLLPPNTRNLEDLIKWHSIAMGWKAAGHTHNKQEEVRDLKI